MSDPRSAESGSLARRRARQLAQAECVIAFAKSEHAPAILYHSFAFRWPGDATGVYELGRRDHTFSFRNPGGATTNQGVATRDYAFGKSDKEVGLGNQAFNFRWHRDAIGVPGDRVGYWSFSFRNQPVRFRNLEVRPI